jgi:hypothetical protein
MSCSVKLPKSGSTTVKASLALSHKPAKMTLKKADLIVKQ